MPTTTDAVLLEIDGPHRDRDVQPTRPPERLELGDGDGARASAWRRSPRTATCASSCCAGHGRVVLRRRRLEARRARSHRRTLARREGAQLLPPLPRLAPPHAGHRGDPAADHRRDPRPLPRRRLRDRDAGRHPARRRGHGVRLPGGEDRRRDRLRARPAPGAGGRPVVGQVDDAHRRVASTRPSRTASAWCRRCIRPTRSSPRRTSSPRRSPATRRSPCRRPNAPSICFADRGLDEALRFEALNAAVGLRLRGPRRRASPRAARSARRGSRASDMRYRVIQWATGGVGRAAIEGIARPSRARARRLLGAQRGQGRAATSASSSASTPIGVAATQRRRRAPRARRRLRRLQPDARRRRRSSRASCARARTSSRRSAGSIPWRGQDVAALEAACRAGGVDAARHRHPPRRHHRALPADGVGALGTRHARARRGVLRHPHLRRRPTSSATSCCSARRPRRRAQSPMVAVPRPRLHPVDRHGRRRARRRARPEQAHAPRDRGRDRADRLADRRDRSRAASPRSASRWEGVGRRRAGHDRRASTGSWARSTSTRRGRFGPEGERFEVEITGDPPVQLTLPRPAPGLDRGGPASATAASSRRRCTA